MVALHALCCISSLISAGYFFEMHHFFPRTSLPLGYTCTSSKLTYKQKRGALVVSDLQRYYTLRNDVFSLIIWLHALRLGIGQKIFTFVHNDALSTIMSKFQVVSLVNLNLEEMRQALVEFCKLLVKDTYAVFYFAGHGFERSGRSYLMPIDATNSYLPKENMATAEVLSAMQATDAKLNVVLLDCCRTEYVK